MDPVAAQLTGHITGATIGARVLVLVLGLVLLAWTIANLRRRALLISMGSLFLAIGLLLILFGIVPNVFNQIAYGLGVQYPPLLYLIGAVVLLMLINVHLASRLSEVDLRCRRLAQELALRAADRGVDG
jgi:hypothetical protein